ncbi:hypothetical protein [Clostridium sp.]|nr:hypothetical protein [Clostridium sp.]
MNKYFKLILVLLCCVILGVILGFNRIHIEFKEWVIIYFGVIIGAHKRYK